MSDNEKRIDRIKMRWTFGKTYDFHFDFETTLSDAEKMFLEMRQLAEADIEYLLSLIPTTPIGDAVKKALDVYAANLETQLAEERAKVERLEKLVNNLLAFQRHHSKK